MNRLKKRAAKHRLLKLGIAIVAGLLIIAIVGPLLVDSDKLGPKLDAHLLPPSAKAIFGHGANGIDVLAWLVYGARLSMLISLTVTIFSIALGTIVGAIAGYYGGRLDAIIMRFTDIVLAFPGILLAMYLATIMPQSIGSLILALSVTGWVGYTRLVRARVIEIKSRDFISAALALGASQHRIIVQHILPHVMGPVIVQASYGVSTLILAEAGLTFLGLGLPLGYPSWGSLLDQGVAHLFSAAYIAIAPGCCIALSVLGFNFLGDGLRDIFDSKSRQF